MAKEITCKRCGEKYWTSKYSKCPRCGLHPHPVLTGLRIVAGIILISWGIVELTTPSLRKNTNKSTITIDEYNRIKTGMTYAQCCEIIGGEGRKESENTLDIGGKVTTVMYRWVGDKTLSYAMLMFQNNELTLKSQSGLD